MISDYINEHAGVIQKLDSNFIKNVEKAVVVIREAFAADGQLLIAGNGGSAADAQHFAAEFVCRFKKERRALPAIALTTDTSVLTAWSNDYSFDSVFARQVEAYGRKGDVFVGITTSGNSKNIIAALTAAKKQGMKTVVFSGGTGGAMKGMAEIEIVVPSTNTPRIQEVHTLVLHSISEEVEKQLFT